MEKTLTFTVEDALLSPIGFSILSGAGLFEGSVSTTNVHVHSMATAYVSTGGEIDLTDALGEADKIDSTAPIFVIETDSDGEPNGKLVSGLIVDEKGKKLTGGTTAAGKAVFVDFYVTKAADQVAELQIDAENFAGYFYVEASTLFRKQSDGVDAPVEITLPNVKIQSNFTFTMASTGDPSTFTFTMDAFPGYTMFDRTKKVLCVMQIIKDSTSSTSETKSVMPHPAGFAIDEASGDSTEATGESE